MLPFAAEFVLTALLITAPFTTWPGSPSRWWHQPGTEYDVDINGHDFDFRPDKGGATGFIDGPFSHNGRYEILRNDAVTSELVLRVHVGTNRSQDSDFDVTLQIDRQGTCTVSGSIDRKPLRQQWVKVTGEGTSCSPYRAVFASNGKSTVITWRAE